MEKKLDYTEPNPSHFCNHVGQYLREHTLGKSDHMLMGCVKSSTCWEIIQLLSGDVPEAVHFYSYFLHCSAKSWI